MTSSSSTSGSGSLSSQSVPSSMDSAGTLPTQDCADGSWSEQEDDESVWGRLYPLGKGFTQLDLRKDNYVFGRDTKSDVCFTAAQFAKTQHFQALSKKHFELIRKSSANGEHVVYIEDWSSNGTFLNGGLIGKGSKQVIQNNDEIQLAKLDNKAYIFIDLKTTNNEQKIPPEVKEKYTISRVLGRGICGEVRLAFSKGKECSKFAIKIISKNTFPSVSPGAPEGNFLEEVDILKKLDHPCIVKVVDVIDTAENLFIVLELVEGGELFDRVATAKRLDEPTTKLIFYQILVGVKYLHDKGFTHRDLKPENVLLCSSGPETAIKITDFGVSKFVGEQSLMKTLCGTPSYLAPEVLKFQGKHGYKKACDCWSLGVILFVCLAGYPPFADHPRKSLKDQILEGSYTFPDRIWKAVSSEAKDLIRKLLTVNPDERISVGEALEHPWMQDDEVVAKAKKLMSRVDPRKEGEMAPPSYVKTSKSEDMTDEVTDEAPPSKKRKSSET